MASKSVMSEETPSIIHDMLPIDILTDVLLRLPVKSLLKFKSISRQWFTLITHPSFIDSYPPRHPRLLVVPPHNTGAQPYGWDRRFYFVDFKKKPRHRITAYEPSHIPYTTNAVTNIVNGLICFYHDHDEKSSMFLYNLTTRECLPFPGPPGGGSSYVGRKCYLGFDPVSKEYKLVCCPGDGCDVLTLMKRNNSEWRWIRALLGCPVGLSRCGGDMCCHDGVLYWPSYQPKGYLIAFHLNREEFQYINYTQEKWDYVSTCAIGGSISAVAISWPREGGNTEYFINLWRQTDTTKDDQSDPIWTKEVIACPFQNPLEKIVTCTDFGVVFLATCYRKVDSATVDCYNLKTRKHKLLSVNNAQGFLSENPTYSQTSYGFRPSLLAQNIMPLKSNSIRGNPVLGL